MSVNENAEKKKETHKWMCVLQGVCMWVWITEHPNPSDLES